MYDFLSSLNEVHYQGPIYSVQLHLLSLNYLVLLQELSKNLIDQNQGLTTTYYKFLNSFFEEGSYLSFVDFFTEIPVITNLA